MIQFPLSFQWIGPVLTVDITRVTEDQKNGPHPPQVKTAVAPCASVSCSSYRFIG